MKVLVVDDEALVRRSLVRALHLAGHEVFEAADGVAGLKLWKEVLPDIVFLDVVMPGLTGPQVLKSLSDQEMLAKVIMMSAFSGDMVASLNKGDIDLFVAKPFDDIFEIVKSAEQLIES